MNLEIRKKIIEICVRLHARNMLAAADGNVSVHCSDQEILITPSGVGKAWIKPNELATITLDNQILSGEPSGERLMHLEVYRYAKKAKAVVHAHPPYAIAWSVAYPEMRELPSEVLSEIILAVGKIPFIPYARPSTSQMGEVLRPYLPDSRVMILSRHGALSWGETLEEAYLGMERLEHAAQILYHSVMLGGLTALPQSEIKALRSMRNTEKTL